MNVNIIILTFLGEMSGFLLRGDFIDPVFWSKFLWPKLVLEQKFVPFELFSNTRIDLTRTHLPQSITIEVMYN